MVGKRWRWKCPLRHRRSTMCMRLASWWCSHWRRGHLQLAHAVGTEKDGDGGGSAYFGEMLDATVGRGHWRRRVSLSRWRSGAPRIGAGTGTDCGSKFFQD
jgi:hypothetical protein